MPETKDASYSWWVHPLAVRDGDLVWLGSVDRRGVNHVHRITDDLVESVALAGPYQADEHNAAALCVGDTTVLAAYSRHNKDPHVRLQIVDKATFTVGPQVQLDFGGTEVTYAQFLYDGTTVTLLTRVDSQTWRYRTSTDFGQTWGPALTLLDGTGYTGLIYVRTRQISPTEALMAGAGHPHSSLTDVYFGRINLTTGEVSKASGTVIGNLASGPGLVPTAFSKVAGPTGNDRVRTFDVGMLGGQPAVLYGLWTEDYVDPVTGELEPMTYKVKRYTGSGEGTSAWPSTPWTKAAGKVFGYKPDTHYHGGMALSEDDRMWTSRFGGTNWIVDEWAWDGTTFVQGPQRAKSEVPQIRPYAIRGGGWLHEDGFAPWITQYYTDLVVEA